MERFIVEMGDDVREIRWRDLLMKYLNTMKWGSFGAVPILRITVRSLCSNREL